MARHLATPGGQATSPEQLRFPIYLQVILRVKWGDKLSKRNLRELQTLAKAMDFVLSGHLGGAPDVLCQRFRALEISQTQGSWQQAQYLELIKMEEPTLVSMTEQRLLNRRELAFHKLAGSRQKAIARGKHE